MKTKIEFFKKYVELSDSTLRSYISWINRLCKFSGNKKSTEITVSDIRKKLHRQKQKATKSGSPWLFPSTQNPKRHISVSIVQKILLAARPENILIGSGVRVFRASYIIHQLQDGADPNWLAYSLGLAGSKQLIPYMKLGGLM